MIVILILALCAYLFLTFAPTFGGKPDAKTQEKISASKHFNGEIFKNLVPTKIDTTSEASPSLLSVLYRLVNPEANKNPTDQLVTQKIKFTSTAFRQWSIGVAWAFFGAVSHG